MCIFKEEKERDWIDHILVATEEKKARNAHFKGSVNQKLQKTYFSTLQEVLVIGTIFFLAEK